jgi:hypothetical protein
MEAVELLQEWHTGVRIRHHAHTRAAVSFEQRGRLLGVPVVILSTAVGTSIFAGGQSNPALTIAAGLLSFAAAVLSSLQTALKYPELAAEHKSAALKYGQFRRQIEVQLAAKTQDEAKVANLLDKFQEEWNTLDDQCPNIPQSIYEKSVEAVKSGLPQHNSPTTAEAAKRDVY